MTVPIAKSLTYNGADQALVTEGTASGGTMNYAIGDSSTTAPTARNPVYNGNEQVLISAGSYVQLVQLSIAWMEDN